MKYREGLDSMNNAENSGNPSVSGNTISTKTTSSYDNTILNLQTQIAAIENKINNMEVSISSLTSAAAANSSNTSK